jgi:hypothetical protein
MTYSNLDLNGVRTIYVGKSDVLAIVISVGDTGSVGDTCSDVLVILVVMCW